MQDLTGARLFLDQLLGEGRVLVQRGENAVAGGLGYGDSPADRARMRNTALAAGGAGAVLGLLLGSKGGRRLASRAALLGGVGVLGKLAWDAWSGGGQPAPPAAGAGEEPPPDTPRVDQLEGPAAEARAVALTRAMIAAARADGHLDRVEAGRIDEALSALAPAVAGLLREEIARPLDAAAIARLADGPQAAREIYLASLVVTGDDDPAERAWLDRLARALDLDQATVACLRRNAGCPA